MLGGFGVAGGNLLSTMSGLNGISLVWRKAERMVVRLNVCSRTVLSAAKNSSLLKSEQPVRVAASGTPFAQSVIMKGEHGAQFNLSGRGMCRLLALRVLSAFYSMVPPLALTFGHSIVHEAAAKEHQILLLQQRNSVCHPAEEEYRCLG